MRMFLAVALCFVLVGCGRTTPPAPDYAERGFTAEITGRVGELDFAATLDVTRQGEATMRLTAPRTLDGIVVSVTPEQTLADAGGVALPYSDRALSRAATLLLPRGQISEVSRRGKADRLTLELREGERVVLLTLDAVSGLPIEAHMLYPCEISVFVVKIQKK